MRKDTSFLERPGTHEDDAYNYSIVWDDSISSVEENIKTGTIKHYGPGSREVSGFDNAWELFNWFRKSLSFISVQLLKKDKDGNICDHWD